MKICFSQVLANHRFVADVSIAAIKGIIVCHFQMNSWNGEWTYQSSETAWKTKLNVEEFEKKTTKLGMKLVVICT